MAECQNHSGHPAVNCHYGFVSITFFFTTIFIDVGMIMIMNDDSRLVTFEKFEFVVCNLLIQHIFTVLCCAVLHCIT